MNIKDVEDLAGLARIELGEEEKKELLSDMESILGYVQAVQKAESGEQISKDKIQNIWREDKPDERDFSEELITGQFPESKNGFLKVKKIL